MTLGTSMNAHDPGTSASRSVSAVAYGKINLHLGVGDVREDGYHDLCTVFQSVDLPEKVTITSIPGACGHRITVAGRDAHLVPTDNTNLVWKAVDAIRACIRSDEYVHIHIDKTVPVAGGMAGGSADCAAALLAAREFFHAQDIIKDQELHEIAASLGADVPFCLMGGTALGLGVGDELTPIPARGVFHWAIVTDKRGLSTPAVFSKLDEQRARAAIDPSRPHSRAGTTDDLIRALFHGDIALLAQHMVNDLQPPAVSLMPSIRSTIDIAQQAGALQAIVSGSGPTVAVLCKDADHALEVATAVAVAGTATATATTTSPASAKPGVQR